MFFVLNSTAIGTPGKTIGTMFAPVHVDILSYEPEKVGGKLNIYYQNHHCLVLVICKAFKFV